MVDNPSHGDDLTRSENRHFAESRYAAPMFTFHAGAGVDLYAGDEAVRMFMENDGLGDDSNFLLRPMRRLVVDRKPPGLVTPLAFSVDGKMIGHFGCLYTGRDRVCFYPAYPTGTDMTKVYDHVTLEVANGRTHATRYDAKGKANRKTPDGFAWRLSAIGDSKIHLWFQMLMQWDTIYKQDKYLQRGVEGNSAAGGEHVKKAFLEYASGIQQPIAVPVHIPKGVTPSYALCIVHYAGSLPHMEIVTTADMFRIDTISKWISGWNDHADVGVQPVAFSRGGHTFVAAVACPPGNTNELVTFGFPYRKKD